MNISFNWLKDLINTDQPVDEVAQRLTSVGLAVESVHALGGDFILDIDLTSNRPDCLSHFGVARELGVIFQVALKAGQAEYDSGPGRTCTQHRRDRGT